jgi:hypothetical protein
MTIPSNPSVSRLFLEFSRRKLLEEYWPRLQGCVASLTETQVWWRPDETSNSIGTLLLHLNGNVRQWLVASFNRVADTRDRPAEFAERRLIPPAELLERLGATMQDASDVLSRLTEADLLSTFNILCELGGPVSRVCDAIERRDQPLANIAVQVEKQRADTVAGFIGAPPHLLLCQWCDAALQAGPVFLQQFPARELEEELAYAHGEMTRPVSVPSTLPT